MMDWTAAYERHRPAILAYLRHRLRHCEDAEDLCQETFERVMRTPTAPHDGPQLRPYLFQTATNLIRTRARRGHRELTMAEMGEGFDVAEIPDACTEGPATRAQMRDLVERLQALMRELPDAQRFAFERGVLRHQAYATIAAETGWSLSKVKINVFRARKALIEGLRDAPPGRGPERAREPGFDGPIRSQGMGPARERANEGQGRYGLL
jgi:RNA polymerase sigma-70 factor (ECF subfamily)